MSAQTPTTDVVAQQPQNNIKNTIAGQLGKTASSVGAGLAGGIMAGFNPLSAIPGISSGPAVSGISAAAPSTSGGNLINVGNPLQNLGEIMKIMNAGSVTNGGMPSISDSDYTIGLDSGKIVNIGATANVGASKVGISLGGWTGIAIAGVAMFLLAKRYGKVH